LSIRSPEDAVLGAVAPIALAAAAGTALVVDLDRDGPAYPGELSLALLAEQGPRRTDLSPPRPGIALLRNGDIGAEEGADVLDALIAGWPAVVLRLPPAMATERVITVVPLAARTVLPTPQGRVVYQRSGWRERAPDGATVLPRPSRATVSRLLSGENALPGDRWVRSWRPLWSPPWV
jgi:hypothetical protein